MWYIISEVTEQSIRQCRSLKRVHLSVRVRRLFEKDGSGKFALHSFNSAVVTVPENRPNYAVNSKIFLKRELKSVKEGSIEAKYSRVAHQVEFTDI